MNKPDLVINIADIYYNYDDEEDTLGKNLLDNNKNSNKNCCYKFIERFFCCFL
jgi:hypothetical protein